MEKNKLYNDGIIVIKKFFNKEEMKAMRDDIEDYINNLSLFKSVFYKVISITGYSIPNILNKIELKNIDNIINNKLKKFLIKNFGDDFYYFFHNDIGINNRSLWHKDSLNDLHIGRFSQYQKISPWKTHNNQKSEIYKCLIYFPTPNQQPILKYIKKSHLDCEIPYDPNILSENIKPISGDIIIFDQRITHKGFGFGGNDSRILLTVGFGKKNIFTDEFRKGTIIRQNRINNYYKIINNINDYYKLIYLCIFIYIYIFVFVY